jgi:hypothetical protein
MLHPDALSPKSAADLTLLSENKPSAIKIDEIFFSGTRGKEFFLNLFNDALSNSDNRRTASST